MKDWDADDWVVMFALAVPMTLIALGVAVAIVASALACGGPQ